MLANNHNLPSANGFCFYDIETTGLSKFDQVTNLAAIRTDADLNIVERKRDILNLRCRRLPWVVPSPGAMLLTRVTPDELEDAAALSHYELTSTVAAAFTAWAPTIFIGFNSLRFDDQCIREALFSTLHPPYITSLAGCGRADLLVMLKVLTAVAPGAIALPEVDGKPSMKLGNVLRATGIDFPDAAAHDALTDVEGTIALMKLMQERCPDIMRHMLTMAFRPSAQKFIEDNLIFRHVTYFGTPNVAYAKRIASHPQNPNSIAIFDLGHAPEPYLRLSVEELMVALRASPRVLRTVKLNAQPSLLPRDPLPGETLLRDPHEADDYTLEARAVTLAMASGFKRNVAEAMQRLQEQYPRSAYVEEQIYDKLLDYADRRLAARFHRISDWRLRYRMVADFADARLRQHALRLIYAETPNALPGNILNAMHDECRYRLLSLDDDLPFRTLHTACEELQSLKAIDAANGGARAAELETIQQYYLMMASGHQ